MRVRVKTHGPSRSGRALAAELGALRLRTPTRFRPRSSDVIINWGDTQQILADCKIVNYPGCVAKAVDKLQAYQIMAMNNVPCPDFTAYRSVANEWLEQGATVVCRSLTRGSGGRGVTIHSEGALPRAPLYTLYVKKRDEYRVFVVNGRVIRITQKRRRRSVENSTVDYRVRNAGNGWVYCQEDCDPPESVGQAGAMAVSVLGLDFGAVDIGYNAHYNEPCVYEVNTAFGLEGTTLTTFAQALREEYLA
jgi:glutathione synthase/RimK-type ligase-like ATP-grasp enzyme